MKIKKILLYFIMGVLCLACNDKAFAAEGVMGLLECKYQFTKGSEHMQTVLTKNNIMTFHYSELSFKDSYDLSNQLFVMSESNGEPWAYNVKNSLLEPASGAGFSNDLLTDNNGILAQDFKSLYEGNNASCPNYVVLKSVGKTGQIFGLGGTETYTAHFSNDEKEYCGSDLSKCPVVGKHVSGGERIVLYGNEKEWHFSTSGDGACDGANVKIFINGTKMKATISYSSSSSFFEKSARSEKTVDVDLSDGWAVEEAKGRNKIEYIYNLLKNNKIKKGFFRGDSGNEKVVFNDGGLASGSCTLSDNWTTNTKLNCTSYSQIETNLTRYKNNWNQKYTDFNNSANEILYSAGGRREKDYSNITDVASLNTVAVKINEYLDKEQKGGELLKAYQEYVDFINENNEKICSDQKNKIDEFQKPLLNQNEALQEKTEKLKTTLEKIQTQLKELGAEEDSEAINGYLENGAEFLEEVKHYYSVTQTNSLLDLNLTFTSGCGIISSNMKAWLLQLLDIIKIIALVLTLVLGMMDFIKGAASGDADAMKKAWKNFSRRLIAVVLLFLIPVLIEFILGLVSIYGVEASNPLCGLK